MKKPTLQFASPNLIAAAILSAVCFLSAPAVHAQASGVWTGGGGDGLWTGDTGNWVGGTVATGSGQSADFSQVDITANTTIHLDAPVTIGHLIFGNLDATPTASWVLDANNNYVNNILTLAGGTPTITVSNLGAGKLTITNVIAGTSGLTKDGPGTLQLDNACTYTGGTTVKNGTFVLGLNSTAGEVNQTDTYILGDPAGGPVMLVVGESTSGNPFKNPVSLATGAVGPITIANYGNQKTTLQTGAIALNGNNIIFTNGPNVTGSFKFLVGNTITGVGNILCVNNGAAGAQMQLSGMNNTGTVTFQGTNVNAAGYLAPTFGANVTAINYASTAGVDTFSAPANPYGVIISSSSVMAFPASGKTITFPSGLSNATLNANSSGSITIATVNAAFRGSITNSGTGTGVTTVSAALTSATISNVIQNSATSPLILSGANTFAAPTLVTKGTLLWNGPATAATKGSPITVSSGGILGGTGGIANMVTVQAGGTLAPGTNDGLTTGTLTLNNGASQAGALSLSGNLYFKLNKSLAQSNDIVSGTLLTNLGTGTLTLTNVGAPLIVNGDRFVLFTHALTNGGALTIVSISGKFTNNLAVDGSVTAGPPAAIVTNSTPVAGPAAGGTLVTINGYNFVSGATVQFGAASPITATFVNSKTITVTTPAQPAGLVTVTVANPDGQFSTTTFTYVAVLPPAITSILPTSGPTIGGTTISITGSNFVSGDTVKFGTGSPIVATFNSSTSLSVTDPAHVAGAVNVTVTDINNLSSTLNNGFTYLAPVSGVWVAPNGGGDGLWTGDTANWSNNVVANGLDQTADFSQGDFTYEQDIHIDAPVTNGSLIFGTTDTGAGVQWMIDSNSAAGNTLTLATAAGTPTITVNDPLALGNSVTLTAVLAGKQGFVLTGGGMLTLGVAGGTTVNTFTGGMTVANGTLFINNNANDANSSDVVTLGSTNAGSSATLLVGGAGFPNPIVLATNAQGTLTIAGDVDLNAHPAMTGPTINLNGNNLTFIAPIGSIGTSKFQNGVNGVGNLTLVQNGSGTVNNLGTYDITGSITMQGTGNGTFTLGTLTANITTLNYNSSSATVVAPTILANNAGTTINSTSSLSLPVVGVISIGAGGNGLTLNANSTGGIVIGSVNNTFGGTLVNSGTGSGVTLITAGIFNNSGITRIVQNSATSPLVLSGNNYYSVPTLVSNGTLLINSPLVAGQAGSPITVYSGGVLGGTGSIANTVTILPGGTLAPGTNDGLTIGTLTLTNHTALSGSLQLSGNLSFKVNNSVSPSSDLVVGTVLTNLGTGTLTINNIGPTLNPGDTFQLFSQPLVGGGALTIVGPVTFINHLAVDGTIQVSGGAITPPVGSISVSGGTLNMLWQGAANQTCRLLSTTNLAQPVWTPEATNVVGADGLSTNMIPVSTGNPQKFYELVTP